jgi:phosphoribosyl 1,2-cyclic phosphodiesterase
MSSPSISVRFWGVRGSFPCSGPETARYGGHTSCVEFRCGEHILIFDAGTGLRPLGQALLHDGKIGETDIFLSHGHLDHVMGLPFFAPLLRRGGRVRLWGGNFETIGGTKAAISRLTGFPLFPIGLDAFPGTLEFSDFRAGDSLTPRPGIRLRTALLHHPGGSVGYRIDYAGRSVAYLTDDESGDGPADPAMLALAKAADLVIVDAMYTDAELPARRGWGHSSWQQGVRFADAAGAKRLCLFHHDPDRGDRALGEIAAAAEGARPGTVVAQEGLQIDL